MTVAALVVSIVSGLAAIASGWFARHSARSAAMSAAAASTTATLDVQRRHAELTPRLRITCRQENPGSDTQRLAVALTGPPALQRLDGLTVAIRDDHPWRGQTSTTAGDPTAEQVAAQIWGPYRFTPGTGPGASPSGGVPGADPTGRSTPTSGMPVGEELPFHLELTTPPAWSQMTPHDWRRERGGVLRLALECHRDGWEPWTLTCEIDTQAAHTVVEVG